MVIKRDFYIDKLMAVRHNGLVKVITGVRRCGKSYLLFNLYRDALKAEGVGDGHFVCVQLDDDDSECLRTPRALSKWVKARIDEAPRPTYVFIDEIQMCKPPDDERGKQGAVTFYDVLSSIMKKDGVDVYVTGSNSEMLSKDIATNFRDRGTEIRVWPLCFSEFVPYSGLEKADALDRFLTWGGMPLAVLAADDAARASYLESLFARLYFKDIVERYNLADEGYALGALVDVLASDVGSLTNPRRLANSMRTEMKVSISEPTVAAYLDHITDSFLFNKIDRWDVKGRRYLSSPSKYYAVDTGLRNARLNFRQTEMSHLMENAICNELLRRGYNVDVGVVESSERNSDGVVEKKRREIDFVVNKGMKKLYIQSALTIAPDGKLEQETASLRRTGDFFRKIVVVGGSQQPRLDEDGILYVGVVTFLMDTSILDSII